MVCWFVIPVLIILVLIQAIYFYQQKEELGRKKGCDISEKNDFLGSSKGMQKLPQKANELFSKHAGILSVV